MFISKIQFAFRVVLWSVPMVHQHLLLYAAGNNNDHGGCRQ